METIDLAHEVKINAKDSIGIEYFLRVNGFRDYSVNYINAKEATIVFSNPEDLIIFILKGILEKNEECSTYSFSSANVEFMIRLEKKLKTFSSADESTIRKILKDT